MTTATREHTTPQTKALTPEGFLQSCIGKNVIIATTGEKQLKGTLESVDKFNMLLMCEGRRIFLSKHSVRYLYQG